MEFNSPAISHQKRRSTFTAKKSQHAQPSTRRTRSPMSNDGHITRHQKRFSSIIKQDEDVAEVQVEIYDTESENDLRAGPVQPFRSPNYLSAFSPNFMTQVGSGVGSGVFKTGSGIWESVTSTDMSVKFNGNDNVKVCIRVRPFNKDEQCEFNDVPLQIDEDCKVITIEPKRKGSDFQNKQTKQKKYNFDFIADPSVEQEELFDKIALPVAQNCLEGVNGCIFAYGQTGAGKTYTIQGYGDEWEDRGILQRSFEYLFETIDQKRKNPCGGEYSEYNLKCSYFEIYNEQINDLLRAGESQPNLHLREDTKKGVQIIGISTVQVDDYNDVIQLLEKGSSKRRVASTKMNEKSSRSHSVLSCFIESKSFGDGMLSERFSTFHIIDLAGSESNKSSMAEGLRLKEAGMINKSLSALGLVIKTLSEKKSSQTKHIPYRSSKLTFILKNSLGGNSKTLVIANVSPSWSHLSETVSTLDFAKRAKLMQNEAQVNDSTTINIQSLQNEIMKLKSQVFGLQQQHFLHEERKESIRSKSASREENSLCMWDEDMLQVKVQSKMMELSIKESLVSMKTEEELFNQAYSSCPRSPLVLDTSARASKIVASLQTAGTQTTIYQTSAVMTQTLLSMDSIDLLNLSDEELQMRKQSQLLKISDQKIRSQSIIKQGDNQNQQELSNIQQLIKSQKNVLILGATQDINFKNLHNQSTLNTIDKLLKTRPSRILLIDPMDSPNNQDVLFNKDKQDDPFQAPFEEVKKIDAYSDKKETEDFMSPDQTLASSNKTNRGSLPQESISKLAQFDAMFSQVDLDLMTQEDFNDDSPRKFESLQLNLVKDTNKDLELFADNMVAEVTSLKETIEQRNKMIEQLEEQLETKEVFQELRELREENEVIKFKMEQEARDYLEQINAVDQQMAVMKQSLDEALEENFSLKNELVDKNTEIENKNIIQTQLETIIDELSQQHDDLTNQLEKAKLDQEEAQAHQNLIANEKIRSLQDEIEDLRVQCSLQTSRSKRMARQNEELNLKLSQVQSCTPEGSQSGRGQNQALSKIPPLQLEAILNNRRLSLIQEIKMQESRSEGDISGSPRFDHTNSPYKDKFEDPSYESRPPSKTPSVSDNYNVTPLKAPLEDSLSPAAQHLVAGLENAAFENEYQQSIRSKSSNQASYDHKDDQIEEQDLVTSQLDRINVGFEADLFDSLKMNKNDQVSVTLRKGINTSRQKFSSISASGYDNSGFFDDEKDEFRSFARSMQSKKDDAVNPLQTDFVTPQVQNSTPYMTCSSLQKKSLTPLVTQQIDMRIIVDPVQVMKVDGQTQVEGGFGRHTSTQVEAIKMTDKEVSVRMKTKSRHVGIQNKSHMHSQLIQTEESESKRDNSSQCQVDCTDSATQHIIQIQEQASMCGGPPRRSQATFTRQIEQVHQSAMIHPLCTDKGVMTEAELQVDQITFTQALPKVVELHEDYVPSAKLSDLILQTKDQAQDVQSEQIQQSNQNVINQKHAKIINKLTKTIESLEAELKTQKIAQESLHSKQEDVTAEKKAMATVIEMYKKQISKIDDEKKQFQISLNELSTAKAMSFDAAVTCKPSQQDASINCLPETSNRMVECLPSTQDNQTITDSPPKMFDVSTLTSIAKTKDSSSSPWIQAKNQSTLTNKVSLAHKTTQNQQEVREKGINTAKLLSREQGTQHDHKKVELQDKSILCSFQQPIISKGTQCSIDSDVPSQKKIQALKKQNDELQARLADKSLKIKEKDGQILQLCQMNESMQDSSRSQISTERKNEFDEEVIQNFCNRIEEQQLKIRDLEAKLQVKSPKRVLLEEGLFRESDTEEVADLKHEIKVLQKQMSNQMEDVELQRQEMYNQLQHIKESQLSQQEMEETHKDLQDKLDIEQRKNAQSKRQLEMQAKYTQELINNTLRMKRETQKMEQKQTQLEQLQQDKDTKLMVEINVQQKLINQSILKQQRDQNASLQTILEEEIESQLNGSSSMDDSQIKQQISEYKAQLQKMSEKHEALQKRFKFEVETSSRNAKYFLEQNKKAEVAYNNLVHEYNIVRQEKFEVDKELIQIKIADNLLEQNKKEPKRVMRKIRSSISQVAADEFNDMGQINELEREFEVSDSDDEPDNTFKSSVVLEGLGGKTQAWLYKNQLTVRNKNPLKKVIMDSLAERHNLTETDQLFCSSSDEADNRYMKESLNTTRQVNVKSKKSRRSARRQGEPTSLIQPRGRSLQSSLNNQNRGHSMPKLVDEKAKLDFSFNVVHQEVFIRNKIAQSRHQPSMKQVIQPLKKMQEARDDLENWVSTNAPYQEFQFGF